MNISEHKVSLESESLKFSPTPQVENPSDSWFFNHVNKKVVITDTPHMTWFK